LKWSQIDITNRILVVERAKNGKSRSIPINETLYAEFQRLKAQSSSQYVFYNEKTQKPITTVRNSWLRACKKAGISGIRLYDATRHAFGTKLAQNGVPVATIASLMGHSDIQMTMRYMHSNDELKRDAVDLLDSSMNVGSSIFLPFRKKPSKDKTPVSQSSQIN
jgi:integrase